MLKEWHRVLKPGGRLILELPCMNKVIAYLANAVNTKSPIFQHMSWLVFWGDPKYRDPAMCHKWGYSYEQLQKLVEEAGFKDVTFMHARYHFPIRDMRMEAVK